MANHSMKKIEFVYEAKPYTLEFNRASVERMERAGFVATDLTEKPLTALPDLFHGALQMHHKGITKERAKEMLDHFTDVRELIAKLAEMYYEPINTLIGDEADESKNVSWEANW